MRWETRRAEQQRKGPSPEHEGNCGDHPSIRPHGPSLAGKRFRSAADGSLSPRPGRGGAVGVRGETSRKRRVVRRGIAPRRCSPTPTRSAAAARAMATSPRLRFPADVVAPAIALRQLASCLAPASANAGYARADAVDPLARRDEQQLQVLAAEGDVARPALRHVDVVDLLAGLVEDGDALAGEVEVAFGVEGDAVRAQGAEERAVRERAVGLDVVAVGLVVADVGDEERAAVWCADDAVGLDEPGGRAASGSCRRPARK